MSDFNYDDVDPAAAGAGAGGPVDASGSNGAGYAPPPPEQEEQQQGGAGVDQFNVSVYGGCGWRGWAGVCVCVWEAPY